MKETRSARVIMTLAAASIAAAIVVPAWILAHHASASTPTKGERETRLDAEAAAIRPRCGGVVMAVTTQDGGSQICCVSARTDGTLGCLR